MVPSLSLDGARSVPHAAEQKAQQLTAPSSPHRGDPAGDLMLFEQMQGAPLLGSSSRSGRRVPPLFQEPTQALETAIDTGRQQSQLRREPSTYDFKISEAQPRAATGQVARHRVIS
jgi:uncharacterized protein GlcG (DUF336 family)